MYDAVRRKEAGWRSVWELGMIESQTGTKHVRSVNLSRSSPYFVITCMALMCSDLYKYESALQVDGAKSRIRSSAKDGKIHMTQQFAYLVPFVQPHNSTEKH